MKINNMTNIHYIENKTIAPIVFKIGISQKN